MVKIKKQNYKKNKTLFNKIKKELRIKIGEDYPITHVGSTAIPNMYGKNIIDILIGVKDNKELDIVTEKLIDLGYFVSRKIMNDNYRFLSSIEEETGSGDIHIHLGILYTKRYSEFIILRNYLLNNADEVINYSNFKRAFVSAQNLVYLCYILVFQRL